jgi:hypothetical protein
MRRLRILLGNRKVDMSGVQRFVLALLIQIVLVPLALGQAHFTFMSNTGNNAVIGIPLAVNPTVGGTPLAAGDEIGVFTPAGLCVGATVWNGVGAVAVTVWEDNPQTVPVDGIKAGELMKFRVWRQSSSIESTSATVTYSMDPSGAGTYVASGIYVMSGFAATGVVYVDRSGQDIPASYSLAQNYPNPFNPSTTIEFSLPKSGFVSLKVFSVTGGLVADVVNENLPAGNYRIRWNAAQAASGTYFYQMLSSHTEGGQAVEFRDTKRLILLK